MTQVYERALSGEERAEFARLTEELKASVA